MIKQEIGDYTNEIECLEQILKTHKRENYPVFITKCSPSSISEFSVFIETDVLNPFYSTEYKNAKMIRERLLKLKKVLQEKHAEV